MCDEAVFVPCFVPIYNHLKGLHITDMAAAGCIAPKGPWAQPITIHLRGHEVAVTW